MWSLFDVKDDNFWQILVLRFWHEFLVNQFSIPPVQYLNMSLKKPATTTRIREKNDPFFWRFLLWGSLEVVKNSDQKVVIFDPFLTHFWPPFEPPYLCESYFKA